MIFQREMGLYIYLAKDRWWTRHPTCSLWGNLHAIFSKAEDAYSRV